MEYGRHLFVVLMIGMLLGLVACKSASAAACESIGDEFSDTKSLAGSQFEEYRRGFGARRDRCRRSICETRESRDIR
jgi:hypothetical protein